MLLAGLVALALVVPASAQHGAEGGEWRSYGGDVGSTKYSPLDQIDRENFGDLELVWSWRTADAFLSKNEAGGEWWSASEEVFDELQAEDPDLWRASRNPLISNLKATPLMVDGVLYLNTPLSQGVAVDAKTGETLWIFNPKSYESGTTTMTVVWNQRGVAYWTDGTEARVYWGTGDGYLLAVDAKTGRPCPDFGVDGRVDLMEGLPNAKRGSRD